MSRFAATETALTEKLVALKVKPEMTVNLLDLSVSLSFAGFAQEEVMAVLLALEQDRTIAFVPGNRIRILKALSRP